MNDKYEELLHKQEKERGISIALEGEMRMNEIVKAYGKINATTLTYTLQHVNLVMLTTIKDLWGEETAKEMKKAVEEKIEDFINNNWGNDDKGKQN